MKTFTQTVCETKLVVILHALGQMVPSFCSIHQQGLLMLQEGAVRGKGSACRPLSAEDAHAIIETCLNTAPVVQRATQARFIKMTIKWAKLFTPGKKYPHRHSDWGHTNQECTQEVIISPSFLECIIIS